MDQLKKLFAALSLAQKIGLGIVIVALAVGFPMFTRWQHESNLRPLFTGMAPEDAGAIVAKLKESGVEYKLAENGTSVLVPADKVDESRLELAAEGLPKTGRIGFELFDKTNLSLTDFGEHVNYRRAVEGELEKTIKSMNAIDQARVSVTFPKDSVFLDSREPAKASILVHLKPGMHLQPQNVVAITNLVASSVEGLTPDAVAVVDTQGNLLSRQRKPSIDGSDGAEATLDYKHQIEKDLTSKVEATLEPLLGDGKFRVGVTVDCDFSTSEQTDEIYDPSRSVIANSQKTEDLSQGAGVNGVPGTPSNLPRSQIRSQVNGAVGGTAVSRRTENSTFETSRTVRAVKVPRGTVKKISAALLIDQDVEWQVKGKQRVRVLIPPTPEKLKTIHDIVAGVLGISTDRGDQLVVETLPFEQTRNAQDASLESAKPTTPGKFTIQDLMADKRMLIGVAVGLLLILLLAGFLLRKSKSTPLSAQLMEKQGIAAGAPDHARGGADSGSKQVGAAEQSKSSDNAKAVAELDEIAPLLVLNTHAKTLITHLRTAVNKDPDAAAAVIRAWIEET
jgi:flagellar M-ring protein FliF